MSPHSQLDQQNHVKVKLLHYYSMASIILMGEKSVSCVFNVEEKYVILSRV